MFKLSPQANLSHNFLDHQLLQTNGSKELQLFVLSILRKLFRLQSFLELDLKIKVG